MIKRHLEHICFSNIFGRQMRFIAGPRQTGKTTLAKAFLKDKKSSKLYFNWDERDIRDKYKYDPYFFESTLYNSKSKPWLCFDEIHKMPKWKNILKDYFDRYENEANFTITGSARLDLFRKSGDSLAGRYFLFHLFPLTLSEVVNKTVPMISEKDTALDFINKRIHRNTYEQKALEHLLAMSGFPEPFIKGRADFHLRWKKDMVDRIIQEDIRSITRIIDLENIATVMMLLPERIGSILSLNSLREDLEVSHTAVRNYISALQKSYVIFELKPYVAKIARSIKKEKKVYYFDWTRCEDLSIKFENYIALELKSMISLWNDKGIGVFDLYFIRTKDGVETDFLITKNNKPWCLFDAKSGDGQIAAHHYKHSKFLGDIPFIQLTLQNQIMRKERDIFFRISASRFF